MSHAEPVPPLNPKPFSPAVLLQVLGACGVFACLAMAGAGALHAFARVRSEPPPAPPLEAQPAPVAAPARMAPAPAPPPAVDDTPAPPPPAQGRSTVPVKPSFSCDKATTATEHAICDAPELAENDNTLAGLYAAKRPGNPDLKRSQLEFLGNMNRCRGAFECIQALQQQRIAQLEALP